MRVLENVSVELDGFDLGSRLASYGFGVWLR
jgi:hypothetical protein